MSQNNLLSRLLSGEEGQQNNQNINPDYHNINNMNNMNNKYDYEKQLYPQNNNLIQKNISNEERYKIKQDVQQELSIILTRQSETSTPDDSFLLTTLDTLLHRYAFLSNEVKQGIKNEIYLDLVGYGILQQYLDDPTVTEIIICNYKNIWVEQFGRMIKTQTQFGSEQEFRNFIDKIVQPLGRRVDDAQPMANARLKDKSRVNIAIPPIAADGSTMAIRKFSKRIFTLEDYIEKESMTYDMGEFLKYIVAGGKNVIVSGGTGSGKTTLLNCLSRFIPDEEAILTIEDLLELQLVQPCLRRMEARGPNAEGKGAVTIRDCLVNALRMRPDRIIIGECRSHEIVDMLQAMNTGHDGSLTTVHANNAKDMIERLYTMYLMGGFDVPEKAVKAQISSAIHVIVQAARLEDGSRRIIQVSEIVGFGKNGAIKNNEYVEKLNLNKKFLIKNADATEVYIQDIFRFNQNKQCFETTGWIPTFLEDLKSKGFEIDESNFEEGELYVSSNRK